MMSVPGSVLGPAAGGRAKRLVQVEVRDKRDQLLEGCSIEFFLDGEPTGSVPLSFGRATFEAPDDGSEVSVSVSGYQRRQNVKLKRHETGRAVVLDVPA